MNASAITELFADFAAASWRAAWFIAVLAVLRGFVRGRIPAGVWFVAWIIVAVRLLIPFSVPASWSPYNFIAAPPPATTATLESAAVARAPNAQPPDAMVTSLPDVAPPHATVDRPSMEKGLAVVWLGGAAFLLLLRAIAAWRFRTALADAPAADERVRAMARRLAADWRIAAAPRCVETDAVAAPALAGVARPWLLFPPGFAARLSDDELRLVLRHELAHWRRRDPLAQALLQIAVALHWFNPLAWLAARLARADCELACDEFVLRHESADGASAYGSVLLKTSGLLRDRRLPGAVVAILEGKHQLAQRVRLIADYRASTVGRVLGGTLLLIVLAAASVTRESNAQETPAPALTAPASPAPKQTDATEARETEPKVSSQESNHARDRLQQSVDAQRQKVDALARQLQNHRQTHLLGSIDERTQQIIAAMQAAHQTHQRAYRAVEAASARAAQIQDYRARGLDLTGLLFIGSHPQVVRLQSLVSQQRIAVATLQTRYRAAHPNLVAATTALDTTQRELGRAVDAAADQIEAELRVATAAEQAGREEFERIKAVSLAHDHAATESRRLERELRNEREILQGMVARALERTTVTPP